MFVVLKTLLGKLLANTRLVLWLVGIVVGCGILWYGYHLHSSNQALQKEVKHLEQQRQMDEMIFNARWTAEKINTEIFQDTQRALQFSQQQSTQQRQALRDALKDILHDPIVENDQDAQYRRSVGVVAERMYQSYCQAYPDTPNCTTQ